MVARRWIFSCFLIVGTSLYIIIYRIQILHTGTVTVARSRTTEMDYLRKSNLTAIEWAHAVNSQQKLNDALKSSVKMIEADIILGTLINDASGKKIPVMGHPPDNTSDISLEAFLRKILDFNKNNESSKGVKLDFKSTEVFNDSLQTLTELWDLMDYPIWLNADILKGPVNATSAKPVDPTDFLAGCKRFNSAILSIGWTTQWGQNYTVGSYSENDINEMLEVIASNTIQNTKHKITFPVRAGIAAQSLNQLKTLYNELNSTNDVTLTIWSSKDDHVNIDDLRQLILAFGIDKVYLDVPEEVSGKLNLGNLSNSAVKCFINFSLISLGVLVTSFLVHKYLI